MFENDPEFRKLKSEFEKAKNEYEIALQHRERVRQMLTKKREEIISSRRPVGAFSNTDEPEEKASKPQNSKIDKGFRIYLGPILGWICLVSSANSLPLQEPEDYSYIKDTFDQISLKIFWRARDRYEKCKKNLEKYVPKEKYVRREIEMLRNRIKVNLNDEANLQLLGIESSDSNIKQAQQKVEEACKIALAFYKSQPNPKSKRAIVVLLENLADSQFLGWESPTTESMQKEFEILFQEGRLNKE
jgi:hypothetical protein